MGNTKMGNTKILGIILLIWAVLVGLIIYLLINECEDSSNNNTTTVETTPAPATATTPAPEAFSNFDYSVENYDNVSSVADNASQPEAEPVSQEFAEMVSSNNVDAPEVVEEEEEDDMDNALRVEGTDLLIAAAADRFYSIDVRGQLNRNASNDLRGEPQIPFNSTYTPFHSSAIAGESAIPSGRLG